MQMRHRLPRFLALVDNKPVGGQAELLRDLSGGIEKMSVVAGLVHVGDSGNFVARDEEDVDRGLRIDIPQSDDVLVLPNDLAGDLARNNPGEERRHPVGSTRSRLFRGHLLRLARPCFGHDPEVDEAKRALLVGAGGSLVANARYRMGVGLASGAPWTTLGINVTGSFLLGIVVGASPATS